MSEFDEYIVHEEPGQRDKASAWQMAIGLQDVDGLKPSKFLLQQVKANIEGKISKSRTLHIRWNELEKPEQTGTVRRSGLGHF